MPEAGAAITLMVDDPAQLDLLPAGAPVRVCLDIDASLRIGRVHLGVRRSPRAHPGRRGSARLGGGRSAACAWSA